LGNSNAKDISHTKDVLFNTKDLRKDKIPNIYVHSDVTPFNNDHI